MSAQAGAVDSEYSEEARGAAWVPSHPEWLVTTEFAGRNVKMTNVRTGEAVCKFGQYGQGPGEFDGLWGVAVSADSSLVIVADRNNHRLQALRLKVAADSKSAELEFDRFIGKGYGRGKGQLMEPYGVALLRGTDGTETVLVSDDHRVSEFTLEGTFVRVFAGAAEPGSGEGEFNCPEGIAVLPSGEVAIADMDNNRVQIFSRDGKYQRQFGTEGDADGELQDPISLASDPTGNILVADFNTHRLQVFSSEGKHLCTHNDLGLEGHCCKALALRGRQLAVVDEGALVVRPWLKGKMARSAA